jgi:hypothetical protein
MVPDSATVTTVTIDAKTFNGFMLGSLARKNDVTGAQRTRQPAVMERLHGAQVSQKVSV